MRNQMCVRVRLLLGLGIVMAGIPDFVEAQTTTRVSVATGGGQTFGPRGDEPAISADGRFVAFDSAGLLVLGDTNGERDVFVHDRQTVTTTRVSVATGGGQANDGSYVDGSALSADGRFVGFSSSASNLVPGDTNGTIDAFVHDRQTGVTTRVSVAKGGGQANFGSENVTISADGRFVVFDSNATNLVPGDTNGRSDVFVYDRQMGVTTRVSVPTGGGQGNGSSGEKLALSADGRFVAFKSFAANLVPGDTNGVGDVFVHDRQTGTTTRVSVATGGGQANGPSEEAPRLSTDGRFVAFGSAATNLVPGDTNNVIDIFVHDRQTGETTRASGATGGGQANGENSAYGALSLNGRFVVFGSDATNLVPGDTNGVADVFVHDRQTGETTRVSESSAGAEGNGESHDPDSSADGQFIVFFSEASNLVPGDTNGVGDIFVHDRGPSAGANSPNGADLNGDGKADIVWRNTSSGMVAVWLMNSTTIAASGFPASVPFEWQIAGIGDVNGDGKADVIWRHATSSTVAVWLMNGLTITSVGFPGSASPEWQIAEVGDVNGDGKADLLWRNENSGVVAIWLMTGATIASPGFLGGVAAQWQIEGLGDVNGDGKADVIWRNSTSGTVAVWVMNGLSIVSTGFPGGAPTGWSIQAVGDLNGDGKADLIWHNTANGGVAGWLMNGAALASSAVLAGKSGEWAMAQVGDVDGDGKADVIWRNTSTGMVEVWLMNGVAIASTGSPGTTSTNWEIQ